MGLALRSSLLRSLLLIFFQHTVNLLLVESRHWYANCHWFFRFGSHYRYLGGLLTVRVVVPAGCLFREVVEIPFREGVMERIAAFARAVSRSVFLIIFSVVL